MRLGIVCIAFGLLAFASTAAAQVAVLRTDSADVDVAAALGNFIGDRIVVTTEADLARTGAEPDARVSVDRARSLLVVVAGEPPRTSSRALDPKLIARSPYAVALAAAELLDLLRNEPPAPIDELAIVVPRSTSAPATTETPRSSDSAGPAPARSEALPAPQPSAAAPPVSLQPPAATAPAPELAPADTSAASADTDDSATELQHIRSSRGLDYALGIDLELQAQPNSDLSFVRPAVYAELAWDRSERGLFWTAGIRASAPLARDLQLTAAAGPAAGLQLHAQGFDAALQGTAGYALGRLAVAAHVAAGATYLRVEARDAGGSAFGQADARFSPLVAAGLGARVSVALGFALAVRAEAQWVGRETVFHVAAAPVLDGGPFRLGFLAGVLWESALGPP